MLNDSSFDISTSVGSSPVASKNSEKSLELAGVVSVSVSAVVVSIAVVTEIGGSSEITVSAVPCDAAPGKTSPCVVAEG